MLEFLNNNISTILTFITGGGLSAIASVAVTKRQAQRQAMREIQAAYQETIKDLREDKAEMKRENDELRRLIDDLQKKVNDISVEMASLRRYKCIDFDCKLRKTE